jgi:IMP cyclohydrolase
MENIEPIIAQNMENLKNNPYPGRGIVLGMTPDGQSLAQVYWIMGRSANSRNRIFVVEDGFVKTQAFDEAKVEDPSLIIYYPARHYHNCHIITNGDQTDTIYKALQRGGSFEEALATRSYEPDAPNYTPRISGLTDLDHPRLAFQLAIIKKGRHAESCVFDFCNFQNPHPGIGYCLHTYQGDGNPLPPFEGQPYPVALPNSLDEIALYYWKLLNNDNKIALLVKLINRQTGQATLRILNKHLIT